MKFTLVALGLSRLRTESFVKVKKVSETGKAKLKASPEASEDRLSDAHDRMEELDTTKTTVDQPATIDDEARKVVAASHEHVRYHEDKVAEYNNQLLTRDGEAPKELEFLSMLDSQATSLLADLQ